jgi:S-adenosylmethionine decarboxylase
MVRAVDAGVEWMIEADGCALDGLRSAETLRALLDDVVRRLELKVVGVPLWHSFPGHAGVTGMYLLSESHLTVHTYPELDLVTLNLYACRPRPEYPWRAELAARLGARRVRVRCVTRALDGFTEGEALDG